MNKNNFSFTTFFIFISLVFFSCAIFSQNQISGTLDCPGTARYTKIDFNANCQFVINESGGTEKMVKLKIYNAQVKISPYSMYCGWNGKNYSKSDLGITDWPNTLTAKNLVIAPIVYYKGQRIKTYTSMSTCYENGNCEEIGVAYVKQLGESFSLSDFKVSSTVELANSRYASQNVKSLDDIINKLHSNSSANTSLQNNNYGASNSNSGQMSNYNNNSTNSYNNQNSVNYSTPKNTSNKSNLEVISDAFSGLATQINERNKELERQEEEKELQKQAAEEERLNRLAERLNMINARKHLFNKYPEGKMPLSSESKNFSDVFYFIYSYDPKSTDKDYPQISVSNVFSVSKYADGTWPSKENLRESISKKSKISNFTIVGFYQDISAANKERNYLVNSAQNYNYNVADVYYEGKKKDSTVETDYWGNPIKKDTQVNNNASTANVTSKVDYWGNPIKEEATSINNKQPANEVDYWGNPIKKEENKSTNNGAKACLFIGRYNVTNKGLLCSDRDWIQKEVADFKEYSVLEKEFKEEYKGRDPVTDFIDYNQTVVVYAYQAKRSGWDCTPHVVIIKKARDIESCQKEIDEYQAKYPNEFHTNPEQKFSKKGIPPKITNIKENLHGVIGDFKTVEKGDGTCFILAKLKNTKTDKKAIVDIQGDDGQFYREIIAPGGVNTQTYKGKKLTISVSYVDVNIQPEIKIFEFVKGKVRDMVTNEDGNLKMKKWDTACMCVRG